MANLKSYPSRILAQDAAGFLMSHGIAARVVGGTDPFGGAGIYPTGGVFGVIVEDADLERARALLTEMESLPNPESDLEAQSRPDLSKLPPGTVAPCPACGAPLPLDASLERCPACSAAVDVPEVLVAAYGPEVLAGCFPEAGADVPPELLESVEVSCPACSYPLDGLAESGSCPECGQAYSKREILRGRMGLE